MRNKKGFTLIELLAIIVILAIIAVITVPIILNIIDNAEKGSAQDSALGYEDAIQKYYVKKSIQNPELELPDGYMEISDLPSDFIVSGEAPSDGWIKFKKGSVERFSLKYKDYAVTMDNDKNVISEKQQNIEPHVPSDYQEIEYLESTGMQYIDTRITGESKWNITAQYTSASDDSKILVGCGTNAAQWFGQRNNNYAVGADSSFVFNSSSLEKNDISLSFTSNNLSATIGDSVKNRSGSLNSNNFYLFQYPYTDERFYSSVRVYKADVYKNDEKVRQFVPVIRKSDNKPGMLDLANYSDNLFVSDRNKPNKFSTGNIEQTIGKSEFIVNRNTTTENDTSATAYIDLTLPAGTYTLSVEGLNLYNSTTDRIMLRDTNSKTVVDKVQTGSPKTFTLSKTTNINRITFVINAQSIYENQLVKVMLNKGSTALPYDKFYTNEGAGEFITGPEI